MKRYTITVQWHQDRGMGETLTTAKEYHKEFKDELSAQEYAEKLVSRVGGYDYELTEG